MRETRTLYGAGVNVRDCRCCRGSSLESKEQRKASGAAISRGRGWGLFVFSLAIKSSTCGREPATLEVDRKGPDHGLGDWGFPGFHPDQLVDGAAVY